MSTTTTATSQGETALPDGAGQTYPVDSAVRPCCKGIGTHGRYCPRRDIPVPEGADDPHVDDWQPAFEDKPVYRLVWSKPFDSSLDLRVVVVQYEDGTIADGDVDPDDAPLVHIASSDYSPTDARALAASILRAADLAEQWAVKR